MITIHPSYISIMRIYLSSSGLNRASYVEYAHNKYIKFNDWFQDWAYCSSQLGCCGLVIMLNNYELYNN